VPGDAVTIRTGRGPLYRGFRFVITALWSALFRPTVVGKDLVPPSGPVILAPVHRSNLDFAFTIFLTPRKGFFMAKDSLWTVPVMRSWITMLGAFPVKRGTADREAMATAQRVLERGQVLVLFPEGTRQEGHLVDKLHNGAVFLAARTGASIVPVGIGHTERAMPRGAKLPRPVKVRLVVGEPIAPPPADHRLSQAELNERSETLRQALQVLYDEAMES
jgi:1-acyl-sn-glycerol-3-phosphate acyltransferase